MGDALRMVLLVDPTRCACGEHLYAGERAGLDERTGSPRCLWCIADQKAGRRPPRRRATATPLPYTPASTSYSPTSGYPPRRSRRSRRRSPSGAVSVLLTLTLLVGALWAKGHWFGDAGASSTVAGIPITPVNDVAGGGLTTPIAGSARSSWPPVPADARDRPLALPPAQQSTSSRYAFMDTMTGPGSEPVRWDPCRPIHVVVNRATAPAGSGQLVETALARVSAATGLRFVLDGDTSEEPSEDRAPFDRGRYGNRWSPVLVAWTDPAKLPRLQGRVIGLGGPVSAPFSTNTEKHWVSGTVYLDAPAFRDVLSRQNGQAQAEAVVMHEVAHLVGLTHFDDASQLMAPHNSGKLGFGDGDLEGLRRLGGGPCFS